MAEGLHQGFAAEPSAQVCARERERERVLWLRENIMVERVLWLCFCWVVVKLAERGVC